MVQFYPWYNLVFSFFPVYGNTVGNLASGSSVISAISNCSLFRTKNNILFPLELPFNPLLWIYPLFRIIFRFPREYEIAGFNCI